MKTDSLNSDQHTLTTSGNGPHTDRIDRITTGSGSDNSCLETTDNFLSRIPLQAIEAAGTAKNLSGSDPMDLIRQLVPTSLRKRKFRADSFAAKLTKQQLATVISWLQEYSIESVRTRVAAAAPEGFGLQVHSSALKRLRNSIKNTELNFWIENAMDAAFDILDADTSVDTAPLREALSLLLHSRIMTYVREQTDPVSIDRLLSALTRLEKLKTHIAQRPHLATGEKTTRHKVEVQITTNPGTPTPITIHATHQALPPDRPKDFVSPE
jgi:hypothetical protein